jgi:hypothetical protein
LAFFSARFLRSTLIFSIKVLISGAGTLRVEFIALPSSKLVGERLTKFRDKAIKQTPGFQHTPPDADPFPQKLVVAFVVTPASHHFFEGLA